MPSPLPSRAEAWARLRAAGPAPWVLRHAACVEALATAIADAATRNGHPVDRDLVQVAAILHDLGRSVVQGPTHAHAGADLLRADGADPRLVAAVEKHTGAGLDAEDAQRIGLPPGDYIPSMLEEKIVAHADNLYSGDRRMGLDQIQAKYEAKGLQKAWQRIAALHKELEAATGTDLERLTPADLPPA